MIYFEKAEAEMLDVKNFLKKYLSVPSVGYSWDYWHRVIQVF